MEKDRGEGEEEKERHWDKGQIDCQDREDEKERETLCQERLCGSSWSRAYVITS